VRSWPTPSSKLLTARTVRFLTDAEVDKFMLDMANELSKRMIKVGVRGKMLNIKVMKRAANAPVETPKFLGHGHCDEFRRSADVGLATDDAAVLGAQAVKLMQALMIPATELRGIALQVQQLDTGADTSQRRLTFGKASAPADKPATPATARKSGIAPPLAIVIDDPPIASTSRIAIHSSQDVVPVVVVDPRRTRSTTPSAPAVVQPALVLKQAKRGAAGTGKAAVQVQTKFKGGKLHDPRRRLDTTVPLHPTAAQLEALEIDHDFWDAIAGNRQLQMDTWQNAQLARDARERERSGGMLLRARSATPGPLDEGVAVAAAPRKTARDVVLPRLPRFAGKDDLDGVRDRVEAWVDAAAEAGPVDRDVTKLRAFLVARADRAQPAGADLALVAGVVAWWRCLLEGAPRVHGDWWTAYEGVREAVDAVTGLAPMVV
jgi:DNA repair protein REV1